MIVYVVRHAEAVEVSGLIVDEWRYLTEKGRKAAKDMGEAISKYGPKPRLILTSPLTRTVQTAEIMAGNACRKNIVVASSLLQPGGDTTELILTIRKGKDAKRVMLVGHEPQLGALVAVLLGRQDEVITLKKGACVALKLDPSAGGKPAAFLWYLAPGKNRTTSFKKAFPQTVA
jgi:phosphohistidine phosphatase